MDKHICKIQQKCQITLKVSKYLLSIYIFITNYQHFVNWHHQMGYTLGSITLSHSTHSIKLYKNQSQKE